MTMPVDHRVLLTVRGTSRAANYNDARTIHNDTAGSPRGIEAARALGDLSHNVYLPAENAGEMGGTKPNEVLFVDTWLNVEGLMKFFSAPGVDEQGGRLFAQKNPTVWMAARGAFTFHLPSPSDAKERFLGMLRAPIASPERAIEVFASGKASDLATARRRGQLAHELYIKLNPPGDTSPLELLAIDTWTSVDAMREHYASGTMSALAAAFAGAPEGSIWRQADGWSEW